MHDVLDNWNGVPVILLSNKNLDAAKMSRCLQVMQTQPSKDDLDKLTIGLLYDNSSFVSLDAGRPGSRQVSTEERNRISGLCLAFSRVNSLISDERGFHSRDFVYLLKSLRRALVAKQPAVLGRDRRVDFDGATLLEGLRRNFQTVNPSNFSIVAKEFLHQCGLRDPSWPCVEEDEHGNTFYPPSDKLVVSPQVLTSLKASIDDKHPDGETNWLSPRKF